MDAREVGCVPCAPKELAVAGLASEIRSLIDDANQTSRIIIEFLKNDGNKTCATQGANPIGCYLDDLREQRSDLRELVSRLGLIQDLLAG